MVSSLNPFIQAAEMLEGDYDNLVQCLLYVTFSAPQEGPARYVEAMNRIVELQGDTEFESIEDVITILRKAGEDEQR